MLAYQGENIMTKSVERKYFKLYENLELEYDKDKPNQKKIDSYEKEIQLMIQKYPRLIGKYWSNKK